VKQGNTIRVLPDNLINKIAAGEVIDRPAAVCKELVENAIDAGASRIEVIIKGGGTQLLQVVDNGSGMGEEDAILAIQRHATSKIRTLQDIERIHTLGFRGEALASIAAVARVELRTVPAGSISGTALFIEGGVVQRIEESGGNHGTSIAVKNLFFNTPARRKFLRSENAEYRQILRVLDRFALAYPEVDFALTNDEQAVFNLRAAPLDERIAAVLGKHVRDNLIKIEDESAVLRISGYVGNTELLRKTRNDQHLFLNRRAISDRTLIFAVTSAYGELIPRGQFPLHVLFLELDPEQVDVNVHPTKNEVRFADPNLIFNLVRGAVKRALRSDDIIPNATDANPMSRDDMLRRFRTSVIEEMRSFSGEQVQIDFDAVPSAPDPVPESAPPEQKRLRQAEPMMIWQLHNKYLLAPIKSGLVVIDQHVAHERILYERAKKNLQEKSGAGQQLLFPKTIDLSHEDFAVLMEILPFLERIGFIIKGFSGSTVVLEGVPVGLRIGDEEKLLTDILNEYKERQTTEKDIRERVVRSFSCRTAIMSGDRLSPEAMVALIDQLFATENPYFCPHGRPVMITITIDELDKRFERK